MPSFLNKVFGRKKDDKSPSSPTSSSHKDTTKRHSNASLLEGKYEAVSPSVSPSAAKFAESTQQQSKDKDGGPLAMFRTRSRNVMDQPRSSSVSSTPTPHLTLNLPVPKEEKSRALGVVFEADPDKISTISETAIGERRMSPLEALVLVKACSENIIQHGGLETLGLMHPHWYSASPEVQQKLVSLYIASLGSHTPNPVTTLSPTPTSPMAIFASELEYTQSVHDVAAVLRWVIRHVRLDGQSFGKAGGDAEWGWYVDFAKKERDGGYAPAAFSQVLAPLLPAAHLQLLNTTLDIISSLAAHAETTGASGSKLSMLFGLWLLVARRGKSGEEWSAFYKRWERAGRILEHLFLAHVREESLAGKMPLRLSELVKHYPYTNQHAGAVDPKEDLPLIPRPRFSTRKCDALYVRIDTRLPFSNAKRPANKEHPLHLITEAINAVPASDVSLAQDANEIWQDIKKRNSEENQVGETYLALSRILDDETLRIISLIPTDSNSTERPATPSTLASSVTTPLLRPPAPQRRRSSSTGAVGKNKPAENGGRSSHFRDSTAPAASTFTNWNDFSVIGFGESLLTKDFAATLENDAEVTVPSPAPAPATSTWAPKKRRNTSPGRSTSRRTSTDAPSASAKPTLAPTPEKQQPLLKCLEIVQVDESFVDFWNDALLDQVSSSWPSFIVCQLKPGAWKVGLLIIEHTYTSPPPPPLPAIPASAQTQGQVNGEKRASSPRPSMSSNVSARKSFTFTPAKKRFSFFTTHSNADLTTRGRKGSRVAPGRSPRIGELGEILPEEPMPVPKAEAELPPIPIVTASPTMLPGDLPPVSVEHVHVADGAIDKPLINLPEEVSVPADDAAQTAEKTLPPAPEEVAVSGGTPAPHVALATSELAEASAAAAAKHAENGKPDLGGENASATAPVDNGAPVVDEQTQSGGEHVEIQGAQEVGASESEKPGSDAGKTEPKSQEPQHDAIAPVMVDNVEEAPSAPPQPVAKDDIVEQSIPTPAPQQTVSSANETIAIDPTPSPHSSEDTVVGSEPILEQPSAENSQQPNADAPEEQTQTQTESDAIDEHQDTQHGVANAADELTAEPSADSADAPAARTETDPAVDGETPESPVSATHHETVEAKAEEQIATQPKPIIHTDKPEEQSATKTEVVA